MDFFLSVRSVLDLLSSTEDRGDEDCFEILPRSRGIISRTDRLNDSSHPGRVCLLWMERSAEELRLENEYVLCGRTKIKKQHIYNKSRGIIQI